MKRTTNKSAADIKNVLLILLAIIAVVMIILGASASALAPVFTGIGFILIAVLIYRYR